MANKYSLMGQLGTFMGQQMTAAQTQIMRDTERIVADRVVTAVAELVDSAPETLDTLRELAEAIQAQEGDLGGIYAELRGRINDLAEALETLANGGGVGEHTHPDATSTASGFMPATDKVKLDNMGDFADFMAGWNNTPDGPAYQEQ